MSLRRSAAVIVAAVALTGRPAMAQPQPDPVIEWNRLMVATVGGQNPFAQARFAAITQLAVFEAVNAISGRYQPYLGSLTAPPTASEEAAAIAAAHGVLRSYFPAAAVTLDAARAASLAAIADGAAKTAGIAVGEAAAAAMVVHRANDGSSPPEFYVPTTTDPGAWLPTPACPPAGGVLAHWGKVAPFGLEDVVQFRSPPPPALTSGLYARDFSEVKTLGAVDSATRRPRETDVARFYNAVLAVATWNPVVAQVAATHQMSLSARARLFALLNMAISDGLVAVMETKYHYVFWRPETAIHDADRDGNPHTAADATFTPLIAAPCFPGYGSAHAAASNAARRVAELFFGDGDIVVSLSHPAVPGVVLDYASFEAITDDIDNARVHGGIHFRFDQRAGSRQGRRIGQWIVAHHLRPRASQ